MIAALERRERKVRKAKGLFQVIAGQYLDIGALIALSILGVLGWSLSFSVLGSFRKIIFCNTSKHLFKNISGHPHKSTI